MKFWLINNTFTVSKLWNIFVQLNSYSVFAKAIENSDELGWHFIIVLAAKVIQLLFIFQTCGRHLKVA